MYYNQKYHPFTTFYNHKYGFHINGARQDAFDAVFKLRPRVVKTLDFSWEIMKRIREAIPDVFLMGRLVVSPQDFGQFINPNAPIADRIRTARQKGIELADRILSQEVNQSRHAVNGKPIFSAWESLNEIFPETASVELQKLYDEYQVAFGQKLIAAGFAPIAMNFATGNFTGQQLVDNFPGTLDTYTYLGFHEYDWPTMDRLHKIGLNEPETPKNIADRIPGVGEGRGNDGMWLCLRYRRIMFSGVRQKYADKHTVIITECGMTQGVQGGQDVGPWHPSHPIAVDDYWQSLLWYNSELMKDDFVMGACLFVTGAAGKPEWASFEHLGPLMNKLAAYQQPVAIPQPPAIAPAQPDASTAIAAKPDQPSQPDQPPKPDAAAAADPVQPLPQPADRGSVTIPPAEQPSQPPQPAVVQPDPNTATVLIPQAVFDYHSHYVLFPPNTEEWWYAAARAYFEKFGSTRGEKLRDALFLRGGRGHTITCINAGPETIAKIKRYHPAAQLDVIQVESPGGLATILRDRIARNAPFG